MRWLFKIGMRVHTAIFRLSGGRVSASLGGMGILLLTAKGRRSGKPRSVPLGYLIDNDSYLVIASYGGSANHPAWYLNLLNEPSATILVKGGRIAVTAHKVDTEAREQLWFRVVAKASIYQKYQDRTQRQIPLVLLTPVAGSP